MRSQANIEARSFSYPQVIADADQAIREIVAFLGPEMLPTVDRMGVAVRPELHRQRGVRDTQA